METTVPSSQGDCTEYRRDLMHGPISSRRPSPRPFPGKHRHCLALVVPHAQEGTQEGLRWGQMTQESCRWNTAGQPGRTRNFGSCSLMVTLAVRTVGMPWGAAWGRGFLLFLIQCQITVLLPGPVEDHRQSKHFFNPQSFQESDCHSSSS